MGSYQMNIGAGVTGVEQIERLGTATDKQTERTKRVDEAIKAYASSNDKLTAKLLDVEKAEVRLEQLREQHRMQNERLAASTDKQTVSQERLNGAMRSHVTDVQAASASIRAFEGHLPIRAVEQFSTKILGLGGLFQAAFPIVGAIAMVEALTKGAEKLGLHLDFWNEITRVQKASNEQLRQSQREYDGLLDKLKEIQKQERRRALIAGDPKNGAMAADLADATDNQDVASANARVNALKDQLRTLQRLAVLPGVRQEDTFRRLEFERPGLVSGADVFQADILGVENQEQAKARMPGVRGELRAAEQSLFNLRKEQQSEMSKVEDDAAKKRLEAAKQVESIENRILELKKRAEEAALRSYFGNSLEGRAAYDQVRLGIEQRDAIRKTPSRATQISGYYTVLRAAAYGENNDAIHQRDLRQDEQLDEISRSSTNKLFGADRKEAALDMRELADILRIPSPAAPAGYRSAQQQLRDVRDNERRSISLMRVSGQLSGQSERDQADSEYGARIRFAQQEYQAELRLAELKKTDAEKDAARADAIDQKNQKIFDAQMEREKAILEMILRQKQEFERNFVGLIHAAASGHLGGFVLGRLESLGDEILVKIAGRIFDRISKSGSGTISIPDVLGGAAKTQVDSTTDNTRATDDNTKALQDLTNVLLYGGASAGGGGRATIGFPSGSNGPGVIGGSSSTIMYGFPGSGGGSGPGGGGLGMDAGMVGGGAVMLASGIKQGGAKGDLQAASGGAMAAGGALAGLAALGVIAPMFAAAGPIGMAVAGALEVASLVAGMFGGGPEKRSREISNTLAFSRFIDPVSINASMTTYGGYADYDRFGGIRGSNLSPFPITQAGYRDPFNNNTIIPGRTTGQFGGAGPVVGELHVHAMDGKSIIDRHQDIGDAIVMAIDRGHTGLQEKVRGF